MTGVSLPFIIVCESGGCWGYWDCSENDYHGSLGDCALYYTLASAQAELANIPRGVNCEIMTLKPVDVPVARVLNLGEANAPRQP